MKLTYSDDQISRKIRISGKAAYWLQGWFKGFQGFLKIKVNHLHGILPRRTASRIGGTARHRPRPPGECHVGCRARETMLA